MAKRCLKVSTLPKFCDDNQAGHGYCSVSSPRSGVATPPVPDQEIGITHSSEVTLESRHVTILITDKPLHTWDLLSQYEARLDAGGYGACAIFVGSMRARHQGREVSAMQIEHYPAMVKKQLEDLLLRYQANRKFIDVLIAHRVKNVRPGDCIVVVAVWSEHREEAYEVNRGIVEALKSTIPFWKKETLTDQSQAWLKDNTR